MSGRKQGTINIDLWADEDYRALTMGAQWLYEYFLSCPSLSLCGVADWRPARISGLNRDLSKDDVQIFGHELEEALFIVTDDTTEEVAIRSFFRHDSILAKPNVTIAAVKHWGNVSSRHIRAVIAHEVQRLHRENPEGFGKANVWECVPSIKTILKATPYDVKNPPSEGSINSSVNSSVNGLDNPESEDSNPSVRVSPTTNYLLLTTSTATPPNGGVTPRRFCIKHPNDTTDACGACARQRAVYEEWARQNPEPAPPTEPSISYPPLSDHQKPCPDDNHKFLYDGTCLYCPTRLEDNAA